MVFLTPHSLHEPIEYRIYLSFLFEFSSLAQLRVLTISFILSSVSYGQAALALWAWANTLNICLVVRPATLLLLYGTDEYAQLACREMKHEHQQS